MAPKRICGMILAFIAELAFVEKGTAINIGDEMCDIHPVKRIDCGFPDIKQKECQNKKCCFDSEIFPVCFRPFEKVDKDSSQCTAINPKARTNCGYPGIGMEKCIEINCCFDSSIPNVNWCFNPLPTVHQVSFLCAATDPKERTHCGFPGISEELCKERKCCLDYSAHKVNRCFFPLLTDSSQCTAINPKARTICGYPGIGREECIEINCCFDSSIPNVNWCFIPLSIENKGSFQCGAIDPEKRTDCGFPGIRGELCKKRNCCLDSTVPNVNNCFFPLSTAYKNASECAAVDPKQRTDCGYVGINADECKKRNCCYDSSIQGVNWCFYALDR